MKYFFTNLGTFYSEYEANVKCVPVRHVRHFSLWEDTSDRLLFQSCIRNKRIWCLLMYMIEGKELVGACGFKPPWGRIVHYCNLYVKVAANYIEAFLNLFKYIYDIYILIESEIIGLKKTHCICCISPLDTDNTTVWEGTNLRHFGTRSWKCCWKSGKGTAVYLGNGCSPQNGWKMPAWHDLQPQLLRLFPRLGPPAKPGA